MTGNTQSCGADGCQNCGKPLTVSDKMRNRGTGLCWQCFVTSSEAALSGVTEEGVEAKAKAELSKLTTVAPANALRSAADFVLPRGRWQVVHQTEEQLTLQHVAAPSCLLALVLFLLGGIPGIAYFLVARKESRLVVRVTPAGSATQLNISWVGTDWRRLAWAFLESLPDASEEELTRTPEARVAAQTADARAASTASEDREKVFEQIRQLGRLREEGLITEEEFESKKADLLSRL